MYLKNIGIASLLLVSSSVNAGMIFSDNFDSYTAGPSILNWDGGANWDVSFGTVDLVKNDNPWGLTCLNDEGYCVDLDGSTSNAGEFASINVGPLGAGNYELSFWLSGNQRSGGDFTASAVLADSWLSLVDQNFSLASDAPWEMYTLNFSLTDVNNPVNIVFSNFGGDNIGMLLDNVMLSSVPEPSIIALFGLGLAGMGFAARKRKQS